MGTVGWLIVGISMFIISTALAAPEKGGDLVQSVPERVARGLEFTEGPVWQPEGYLIFSDIPADRIYALREGQLKVFRDPSGQSNGLAFDRGGRLLACEHANRRVSRTMEDGAVQTIAGEWQGARLNSPNDLAVRWSDGSIYFTDPPYGVSAEDRELDFQGVYRIGPEGELQLLLDDFARPNGLCFSPTEKVLYIADTARDHVRAFDVHEDGTLGGGKVFIGVESPRQMRPDGMKVDAAGNLYIAGVDGVWIVSPEGEHLLTVQLDERPANLAFGDVDGKTLYVTARTGVYRLRTCHAGAVFKRRFPEPRGE